MQICHFVRYSELIIFAGNATSRTMLEPPAHRSGLHGRIHNNRRMKYHGIEAAHDPPELFDKRLNEPFRRHLMFYNTCSPRANIRTA